MSLAPDAATLEAEQQTAHHGTLSRNGWIGLGVTVLVFALAPLFVSDFWVTQILTKALWLGLAASSLIFLSAYGGMVSLGQVAIYGAAGLTYANLVAADGGNPAAWSPWLAIVATIFAGTLLGLMLGFVASRSEGIYFLMLTLAFSVLVYYFSSQVTQVSGFGGVNNVDLPSIVGNPGSEPAKLYFVAMVVCVVLYLWMRYVSRTPFGLSLQGLRDESPRMRALGFHVRAHRTLAFTFAAFIASFAGLLAIWYNRRISPGSIDLGQTIDILIIAVIGGLYRLEGAWVGAFAFALLDNYSREWTPSIGNVLGPERFNTLLGIIFLIIVLASPGGLVGLWESGIDRLRRRRRGGGATRTTTTPGPEGGPAPTTVK